MALDAKPDFLKHVVVFVGAGVSSAAGLPLFNALRSELFADVFEWRWMTKKTQATLKQGLELLAPEYAVSLVDNDHERPREYICGRLSHGLPTVEHRLLAAAIAAGARVYTSNFDELIERASGDAITVAIRRELDDPVGDASLFKLHGSCPEIVVTAEEVLLSVAGPWADAFLADCSEPGRHLLVWGYRGVDPDLAPLVQRGAQMAERCTWIAFSEEDRSKADVLLTDVKQADVQFVDCDVSAARLTAQAILDPDRIVPLTEVPASPPKTASDQRDPNSEKYTIRRQATRASALAHLGSARLGRRAWLGVALRGDSDALRKVIRSYLFDSRVAQLVALAALPPIIARHPVLEGLKALLTAAEGHGVRDSSDRLIDQFGPFADRQGASSDGVEVRARMATLMRSRGRLAEALWMLRHLEQDLEDDGATKLNATWTGRLTYERSILYRLAGDLTAAEDVLQSIDTQNAAIVGANWSMWLEDEQCALAIARGNVAVAARHLARATEFAMAYGQHRLASVDLAIRKLQLDILMGVELQATLAGSKACLHIARRSGVLTPLRHAWIDGVVADAARRAGDQDLATRRHGSLLRSPNLMHRLAAATGFILSAQPVPIDCDGLTRVIGPTFAGGLIEALLNSDVEASGEVGQLAVELRSGRGFLFLN